MKAVVAAFNQEKALVGAFSVITNLRMELFEALVSIQYPGLVSTNHSPPVGHDPAAGVLGAGDGAVVAVLEQLCADPRVLQAPGHAEQLLLLPLDVVAPALGNLDNVYTRYSSSHLSSWPRSV